MPEPKMIDCHCCKGSGEELNHKSVGEEMRRQREARGFTQTKVANRMKMSKAYLSDLEWGARNWRPDLISRYQKALK